MRRLSTALLTLVCFASCAARPKGAARVAAPPPATMLRLDPDGPAVAYALPEGWRIMPAKDEGELVVLWHPGNVNEAVSITLRVTDLDDKIEAVTQEWAMLAATMFHGFHVTDMEQPKYLSDESSSFIIRGVDEAERPSILFFRIRHVGSNIADFWAVIMLTGLLEDSRELTEVGDKLLSSLRVQAQPPPK